MKSQVITAFHGSGTKIEKFDHRFVGIGNDQLGSGFYFTSDQVEAEAYTTKTIDQLNKPGGMLEPTVHVCVINLNHPIHEYDEILFTRDKVKRILLGSPTLRADLENFGDVDGEGFDRVFKEAVDTYSFSQPEEAIKVFNMLSNDFYSNNEGLFLRNVTEVFGIDGVICEFDNGKKHYVAWHPEQIEIVDTYEPEDSIPGTGVMLYHGTSLTDAKAIVDHGIDMNLSSTGYFGRGFYTASKYKLAKSNYADTNPTDAGGVIQISINYHANILDFRNESHGRLLAELTEKISADPHNAPAYAAEMNIDGLYDRSMGGVVIYNPEAVTINGLVTEPDIDKLMGIDLSKIQIDSINHQSPAAIAAAARP